MNTRTKQACIELFERRCRDRGIPLTVQRRAILEAVLDLDNHPTADQICDAVTADMPGISRTTVYRSLETLVRTGVVIKVCHPGNAVRYDPRIEHHHHLVCLRCNRIIDFSDARLDALPIPDASAHGFEILDLRVQLRGLCRRCRRIEGRR